MFDANVTFPPGSSSYKRSKHGVCGAQIAADVRLHTAFEETGESMDSFDYSKSVEASKRPEIDLPPKAVTAYLERMQRGGWIQPFGCLLAMEETSYRVFAYSENAAAMLELVVSHDHESASDSIDGQEAEVLEIGVDARGLFTPTSAEVLEKAATSVDASLSNPLTVRCKRSEKPLYAILHRIDVGFVMDFEPFVFNKNIMVDAATVSISNIGALHSYKLAAKAISRLQSLQGEDITYLCDTVVQEVQELTGYDRVMIYRFHEDEHGEVIAEMRRSDLEPYLGLHYPATDVPLAARFLFMKNKVRMISDCSAEAVKVIQDEELKQPISLAGSTLRAPHGCHTQYMTNMGSIASLVMAVTVNYTEEQLDDVDSSGYQQKGRKLWGLIVCHHTSPRAVPFPLRAACELLAQVFGLQLNMEVELGAQIREKQMLRTQTLLCDMLLRDAPIGLVSQSPNLMDLVKCDGAALYYGGGFWLLGITPTEVQIKDIADWLLECHRDSTGLSTDSLAEAGYPSAPSLGDAVCGMAAAKITDEDFLFWFRSHTAKEIKWGGAKHDAQIEDDGRKMSPRSSFKAFLEVVKRKSFPWEDVEMDAIHSLQLILRGSFREINDNETKTMIYTRQPDESKMQVVDELCTVATELVRLIETATVPVFAVDSSGFVNGWNAKVAELTGLPVAEAMGQSLTKDLILHESLYTAERLLFLALKGEEEQNVEIKLKTFGDRKKDKAVILVVNACSSRDVGDNVVGVCFIGQDVTGEKEAMDKFTRIQGDYKAIVQHPNPLFPPIFGADEFGSCSEWNASMESLCGWKRDEVLGRMLVGDVFGTQKMMCCRLKGDDAMTEFVLMLNKAMDGQHTEKFPFAFFDRQAKFVEVLLTAMQRTDAEGRVTGVFCFLQTASVELQRAISIQRTSEKIAAAKLKDLAYVRKQMKTPLYGMSFNRSLLESSDLSADQREFLETSASCERQLKKILDDVELDRIFEEEAGFLELEKSGFFLGSLVDVVISQGMIVCKEKELQLICETTEEVKSMFLFGDQVRLQQILADFLLNAIRFTPSSEGWLEVDVIPTRKRVGSGADVMHLDFRITHPGPGLPQELVREMFERGGWNTQEGLGLGMCTEIVKLMNGGMQYVREIGRNYFLVSVELPLAQRDDAGSTN